MTRALTDEQRAGTLAAIPAGALAPQMKSPARLHFWPLTKQVTSLVKRCVNGGMYMV